MSNPTGPEAGSVLAEVRAGRADQGQAELRTLHSTLQWCLIHATDDEGQAAFGDHGIPLAGDGAPWVSEFAVMELGAALGMSTDSAKRYVGAALEVRYRLPRLWERVASGELPFWKARFVAERTMALPDAGARFVDQHVSFVAHEVSLAEVERQIDAARARFDPEAAEKARRQAVDGRKFDVYTSEVSINGTVDVDGTLDAQDALDLNAALSRRAADLKAAGSEESLDVRRSMAAGDLARGYDPLPFEDTDEVTTKASVRRTVELVVHLDHDTVFGNPATNLGRCENTRTPVLAETIREWCGNPDTAVVVRPVHDLADHVHVAAYEHPTRLAEQAEIVDLTCIFPWCTRPATRCDKDHAIPYADGGPTCSCNSAPLCRGHHRLKTHGRWTYDVLDRGTYLWHSAHGHTYRRDHTGTTPIEPPEPERRT
ncbi:HNH endonuclease signature motif containing protein [Nocardioides lijunqiniae]|uniref:HNH endonuclease signature motif containing protein n=1 Tax=Nocardioides lijunqiniae TaxID=2760832 RepID=UPI001877DCAC|nr:HNH endonuclease signature motif containing protein [Nocardioides lijunqiniae]